MRGFLIFIFLFQINIVFAQNVDLNNLTSAQVQDINKQLSQVTQQQPAQQPDPQAIIISSDTTSSAYTAPSSINIENKSEQKYSVNNSKELERKISERSKDPFMLPNTLFFKYKKKQGDIQGEGYVDESVEPQRRWALKHYKLVAIIWNVKKPKAMITDKLNSTHIFFINDRIANSEGVITGIANGDVVINEKGVETKLKMQR